MCVSQIQQNFHQIITRKEQLVKLILTGHIESKKFYSNAKVRAKKMGNWPEYFERGIFWQWETTFCLGLEYKFKTILKHWYASHKQVSDWLWRRA